jgi:hypothetical protein
MGTESFLLLSSINSVGDFISEKSQGAGYHKKSDNLHTFIITLSNWTGEIRLQGSLVLYPNNDTDWFDLKDLDDQTIIIGDSSTDYDNSISVNSLGNFLWIRAIGTVTSGTITEIRYNY